MVGIKSSHESAIVILAGHGIRFSDSRELAPGIVLHPSVPELPLTSFPATTSSLQRYAALLFMEKIASFSIEIRGHAGSKELAAKAWNALWQFHLLSVACAAPCLPLYSVSGKSFDLVNPNLVIIPASNLHDATTPEIEWAKDHQEKFDVLSKEQRFQRSLLGYTNSHYLRAIESRLMVLWAGIEGLFDVDTELRRRIALYAAILDDGNNDQKFACFNRVKAAYDVRSRAVHGAGSKPAKLEEGYNSARQILIRLLAKCIELGRVPTVNELDMVAVSGHVST